MATLPPNTKKTHVLYKEGMKNHVRESVVLQRRQKGRLPKDIDSNDVCCQKEKRRAVILRITNNVFQGAWQRALHEVPHAFAEPRVLNILLQEVQHRLKESGSLRQASRIGFRLAIIGRFGSRRKGQHGGLVLLGGSWGVVG